jgi:hypothetical protein
LKYFCHMSAVLLSSLICQMYVGHCVLCNYACERHPHLTFVNTTEFKIFWNLKTWRAYYFIKIRKLGSKKVRNLFSKIMENESLLAHGTDDLMNIVFWDVAPCGSCVNRRSGGTYRLDLQDRKPRERGTSLSRWPQT